MLETMVTVTAVHLEAHRHGQKVETAGRRQEEEEEALRMGEEEATHDQQARLGGQHRHQAFRTAA